MKNIKQKKHIQKIIQKQQLCNIIFSILSYGSRNPLTTCWELVVSHIIGQGEDQTWGGWVGWFVGRSGKDLR